MTDLELNGKTEQEYYGWPRWVHTWEDYQEWANLFMPIPDGFFELKEK